MAEQPSYRPHQPITFFDDGRAQRPLVAGTVARGHLRTDRHLLTGQNAPFLRQPTYYSGLAAAAGTNPLGATLLGGSQLLDEDELNSVAEFPFPVNEEVLKHGRNRFMIFCVHCHDPLGAGKGMIVQRGYTPPPSYHIERLRQAPPGHFFKVITQGYGSMPSYRNQVPPRDRWAITAYIRALQLSQRFPAEELTDEMRRGWQDQKSAAESGGQP
jgi:mono/diheme cytochrome c family protein